MGGTSADQRQAVLVELRVNPGAPAHLAVEAFLAVFQRAFAGSPVPPPPHVSNHDMQCWLTRDEIDPTIRVPLPGSSLVRVEGPGISNFRGQFCHNMQ